jgi:hypothetical protein
MTGAFVAVVAALGFVSCRIVAAPLSPLACGATPRAQAPLVGPVSLAHAHNDYEHAHPLDDALAHSFASVEADLWWRDGRIVVSHDGWHRHGTLDALYLQPLARRIAAHGGSVHGDGRPFYLWLDLKEHDAALESALVAALDACPFVARFSDESERSGAVVVVLTGDADAGRALVSRPGWRPFVRDEERLEAPEEASLSPSRRPRAYSLEYGRYLSWDNDDDGAQLRCIVARAHAAGRMVRLWDAPDHPQFWRLAAASGVDFINTDDLDGVAATLGTRERMARR